MTSSNETGGFVVFFVSMALALVYTGWAFVPEEMLCQWGITYYPPKILAYHIPAYFISLLVAVPLLYAGLNLLTSPDLDSLEVLVDIYSQESEIKHHVQHPMKENSDSRCHYLFVLDAQRNENDRSCVTDIYDVDVACINEYLFTRQALQIPMKS